MVGIAQLVRASGCGPEGREFKPRYSPEVREGLLPPNNSNENRNSGPGPTDLSGECVRSSEE